MAPRFCSMKLGANGATFTKTTDAVEEFALEMRTSAFKELSTRDRNERLHELSDSRFFSTRDSSHEMQDNINDPDPTRRRKGFSITRDMLDGPGRVQNVMNVGGGDFSRGVGGSGSDNRKFHQEALALVLDGVITQDAMPDWREDQSIAAFFAKIYDMAMDEARKPGGNRSNRIIDAAPSIYLFTELLKRSEMLIREDFTELWARRIFPIRNLNTYLPQWSYERFAQRGILPSVVDIEQLPSNAPRSSEARVPVLCPLVFFAHAASWTNLELMRYAEAQANGAANIRLDQERIDLAIRMMNVREDLYAFFGDKEVNLRGLFSPTAETGVERITGGPLFGAGTAEQDRQILTSTVKNILETTEQILAPNTIMLSTKSWLYVNDKRYGSLDNNSSSTVLKEAMETLSSFGIEEVMWVPEVGNSLAQTNRIKSHGIQDPEATRLGGGIGVAGQQEMVVMRRDPKVAELVVAKDRIMYPARETRTDRIEARMMQGTGAMAFYQPAAIKIVTNVGPA